MLSCLDEIQKLRSVQVVKTISSSLLANDNGQEQLGPDWMLTHILPWARLITAVHGCPLDHRILCLHRKTRSMEKTVHRESPARSSLSPTRDFIGKKMPQSISLEIRSMLSTDESLHRKTMSTEKVCYTIFGWEKIHRWRWTSVIFGQEDHAWAGWQFHSYLKVWHRYAFSFNTSSVLKKMYLDSK